MPSAYAEVTNFLRGGLNNALDPSNIGDDQLQESAGMEYRPPRVGLFGAQGRSSFGTWANGGNNMYGLVFAQFDVSATSVEGHRLVGFAGTSAFGASANGQTGTFATIKRDLTSGATAFADGVHYGNEWFFWNGTDKSWTVYGQNLAASASHGMIACTGLLHPSASAIASPQVGSTIGTFQMWYTEYREPTPALSTDSPRVNSAFSGTISSITLSATNLGANYTFPATANGGNTYFRVYTTIANGKYPFGYSLQDIAATAGAGSSITDLGGTPAELNDSRIILTEAYQTVAPPGGVAVSINSEPPKPYDMAVFQDSMVSIDRDDRQLVKYSMPDKPHSYPVTYFVPFETEEQDQLTALEVCNNALLVFSSWYGFRMDDLPRATDGDEIFAGRSRAKEPFSHHHGCISPMGTAVFDIYGSGQLCMFVCRDGLHITDGFKTDYACQDLDWEATVNISLLGRARLLNNPKRHRIEFYYPDAASASDAYIWKRLDFYYHPSMLDIRTDANGNVRGFPKLPMLGPTDVPGPAATLGIYNSDWRVYCGSDFGATAWFEGTGTVDNAHLVDANGTINKRWRTKDWYHAGQGGEFEMERVYLSQAQTTASGTYTVTAYCRTDDLGTYSATASVNQALKGNQPLFTMGNRAQSMSLRGAKDDGGAFQEVNYIVWVVKDKERLMSAKSSV